MANNVIIVIVDLTDKEVKPSTGGRTGRQGKRDLEQARLDIVHEFMNGPVLPPSSPLKSSQGLALNLGATIWGHSLTEIMMVLAEHITIEEEIKEMENSSTYIIFRRAIPTVSSGKPADYLRKNRHGRL